MEASDNRKEKGYQINEQENKAMNFTFSVGKLMLPKKYISYKQTNLNLMAEFLGQQNLHSGRTFVDMAPVVQLIIYSKMRMDFAYRFPLFNDLERSYPRGWMLRLEYNWFSVW